MAMCDKGLGQALGSPWVIFGSIPYHFKPIPNSLFSPVFDLRGSAPWPMIDEVILAEGLGMSLGFEADQL